MGDINLVPAAGGIGVEIQDVDLSKDLSDEIFLNIPISVFRDLPSTNTSGFDDCFPITYLSLPTFRMDWLISKKSIISLLYGHLLHAKGCILNYLRGSWA